MSYRTWYDVFPELSTIKSIKLKKQVAIVCQEALGLGGWKLEDIDSIPFTLLIPNTIFSYHMHVQTVTRMAIKIYEEWAVYGDHFQLNYDYLVAGGLLHDVGKLVEYKKNGDQTVKSYLGKNLRHPFLGTALAVKHELPFEVAHIIANHAHEGDGTLRSPEAVIINKCDMLNFQALKSFAGII